MVRTWFLLILLGLTTGCATFRLLQDKCPKHGIRLQPDEVPFSFGNIRTEPAYLEAKKKWFPDVADFAFGGCCPHYKDGPTKTLYFCSECRDAKRLWIASRMKSESAE